jgi:hypothetical protein
MTTVNIDAVRLELLLTELRLPGFKLMWPNLTEQSDKEGWPAARFLAAPCRAQTRRSGPPAHCTKDQAETAFCREVISKRCGLSCAPGAKGIISSRAAGGAPGARSGGPSA